MGFIGRMIDKMFQQDIPVFSQPLYCRECGEIASYADMTIFSPIDLVSGTAIRLYMPAIICTKCESLTKSGGVQSPALNKKECHGTL